jgi:hypothetical protein
MKLHIKINDSSNYKQIKKNPFLILLGCTLTILLISSPAPFLVNPMTMTINNYEDGSLLQNALAEKSDKENPEVLEEQQMDVPILSNETRSQQNVTDQILLPLKETVPRESDSESSDSNPKQKKDSSAVPTNNMADVPPNEEFNVTVPIEPSANNTNATVPLQPSFNNTNIQECQIPLIEGNAPPTNSSSTTAELQLCKVVTNLNLDPSRLKDNPLDDASSFTLVVSGNNPSETQRVKANIPGSQISYTVILKNGNYKVSEMWGDNKVTSGKQGVDPICSAAGYRGTIIPPEGGHYSYCVKVSSDCIGTIHVSAKTCTITNAAFE